MKKSQNPQVKILRKSGFSLVETLISIFIFSLAAAMLVGSFGGFFKTYVSAKKAQKVAESSQYVMNSMAKTIRNSTIDGTPLINSPAIMMFDNSRPACVWYKFEAGILKTALVSVPTVTDISSCAGLSSSAPFSELTKAGEISNVTFSAIPSSEDGTVVGKIMISVVPQGGNATQLQTTVSLRSKTIASAPTPATAPVFSCTSIPSNASLCASDNVGLLVDTSSTVVTACGAPKCEYNCNSGYVKSGNSCAVVSLPDTNNPTVTVFTVPATSNSLTVSVTALTATDNIAVTGYCLTEVNLSAGCSWSGTKPVTYIFGSAGSKTLYAWVRDAVGNVSLSMSASTDITLPTWKLLSFIHSTELSDSGSGTPINIGDSCPTINQTSQYISNCVSNGFEEYDCENRTYICATNNWIAGPCSGLLVYNQNIVTSKQWKTANTACDTPQCGQNGAQDGDNLVADNNVNFLSYPARDACDAIGGRLPTVAELICIANADAINQAYGVFQAHTYWSSTEYNTTSAHAVLFPGGNIMTNGKNSATFVRCVLGQ